jgi:ribulose-bisphosphate carboxylase large chain
MNTDLSSHLSGLRFAVDYHLAGTEAQARANAEVLCIEQTVEAPLEILPAGPIREHLLGRVENFTSRAACRHETVISYPVELLDGTCAQLLHVVFGMSSLKPGIRLARLHLPDAVFKGKGLSGPRFGRAGLRRLVGVPRRPLVCGVLKPLGLAPADLAELAYRFALGGIDLVKDDQGLADHPFCPFEERAARCAEAVARANRETGHTCLYAPHVTGPWETLRRRSLFAKQAGAGGLLICPGLVGFDALRDIARDDSIALPIVSHPALLGSFIVSSDCGLAPSVIFGQLPRLAGADASIYPIYGVGYAMSREDCLAVANATSEPMGQLKPIFPTAAGRMGLDRAREMSELYGSEVLFILGSAIQRHEEGLVKACRAFVDSVARCSQRPTEA